MDLNKENMVFLGLESNIGKRKVQQDTAIAATNVNEDDVDIHKTIAVLCDGMGGMTGGEIASNLCVNQVYNDFYSDDVEYETYNQFLTQEIDMADKKVSSLTDDEGNKLNAGTTMVAIIIEENKLYWASVGDSRLYIIRDNQILQATTDHNYLAQLMKMVESGKLTLEEALADREKEALTSFIGLNGIRYIDANKKPFELVSGDCLVMCSDGLYRSISDEDIKNIVLGCEDDMSGAARYLVEEALNKQMKNQDNVTVVTVKYV